ncbi:hypothetical protein B9Z19DRAFT_1142457 [Tuber borchii]|uniref:Uncharacterized protein n=1 Tax=Tuber borchii TaxID=42251 RepID=A0A2T6ZSN2_TUBBO|nr:hypothetical protein B9Z19DRAFT_1142457 [Tuber borchii]
MSCPYSLPICAYGEKGKVDDKSTCTSGEEHFSDIAAAYRTELEILYDAGYRDVPVDDPMSVLILGLSYSTNFWILKVEGGCNRGSVSFDRAQILDAMVVNHQLTPWYSKGTP